MKQLWRIAMIQDPAQNTDHRLVLTKATLKAAEYLGLTQATLAKVVAISPASVSRMSKGNHLLTPDRAEWQLAALFVRLFRGLDAIVAGDEKSLRAWMQNYNTDLNGIPADLIQTIPGLVGTVEYVDASRAPV
jgi:DNA-binding XRE family transcriptional regulator